MASKNRKKGLGRGLSTLLAETNIDNNASSFTNQFNDLYLPIDKIIPNQHQPRKKFEKQKLQELAESIVKNGIIQPIIVRLQGSKYELIAGERRWRAAQLARIHELPAIVRDVTNEQAAEYAIVENIQREDLTSVEEARSYKSLMETYNYTQEEISVALGKSRSYIANMLRLLTLPTPILIFLEESKLSIGHARALIGTNNPITIARKIISNHLSVRQTEALVKKIRSGSVDPVVKDFKQQKKEIDTRNLEKTLSFETKFKITINQAKDKKSGELIFNYSDLDELDRICSFLIKQ